MNLDKLNQWLPLAANLGLMAGFVLIAMQLKQNTRNLELRARAVQASAHISAESSIMDKNAAGAIPSRDSGPMH